MTSNAFTPAKSLADFAGRLLAENLSESRSDSFSTIRFADLLVNGGAIVSSRADRKGGVAIQKKMGRQPISGLLLPLGGIAMTVI